MTDKTLLLTGATGYLGSNLLPGLLKSGYKVVALKRSFSRLDRIKNYINEIALIEIDDNSLDKIFKQYHIDLIVHMSTDYGRGGATSADIFQANVVFPLKLLNMAIAHGVRKFINTDTALNRDISYYSLSKKHFLEWCGILSKEDNLELINIELQHFYGPGDSDRNFVNYVIKECLNNARELKLTHCEQKRDFVYIDDVVSAYLLIIEYALEHSLTYENFSVGSGKAVSIKMLVKMIHALTSSKTELLFGTVPMRENENTYMQADIDRLTKLGWQIKYNLETGLLATLEAERTCDI